ncbi:MAG: SHOCT domain-containing protein [Clostridiaceae bacterium]|nr:SHOCT domain-containing protein [Clostridiaceae bacterium]
MNLTFKKSFPYKGWTLLDDKILYGNDEIMLEDIVAVTEILANKLMSGTLYLGLNNEKKYSLNYSYKELEIYKIAISHIKAHSGSKKDRMEQSEIDLGHDEIRKKCNVCGKVFCYTMEDYRKNAARQARAGIHALGSVATAAGGSAVGTLANQHMMNEQEKKIVNYEECPHCHSKDLTRLIGEEWETYGEKDETAQKDDLTAAESLKAYKDLLDSGVITQEDFNAKKKQLLGL